MSADAAIFRGRPRSSASGRPSRARRAARGAGARLAVADMEIWKTGACQASVRRRAIVLRIDVSGDLDLARRRAAGAAAGASAGAISARSTSSATIRPSGPVPRSCARSMPRSRAIRRASGDALTRPFRSCSRTSVTCSDISRDAAAPSSRSASRFGAREPSSCGVSSASVSSAACGTSSPSSPMTATVCPTGTSPSWTAIFSRTPEASASTSCVTFSVSSS